MYLTIEIEYEIINGKYNFYNLNDDCEKIEVEFEAEPSWENNGIGDYEYGGTKGNDKGHDYVSLENWGEPTWDITKHTPKENEIILAWTKTKQFDALGNDFCEKYKSEYEGWCE